MDVIACLSLTAVELVAADIFHLRTLTPRFSPGYGLGAAVFFAQYFVLKFYRIFLYPNFFSPLRHLPGPKVRPRKPSFCCSLAQLLTDLS